MVLVAAHAPPIAPAVLSEEDFNMTLKLFLQRSGWQTASSTVQPEAACVDLFFQHNADVIAQVK